MTHLRLEEPSVETGRSDPTEFTFGRAGLLLALLTISHGIRSDGASPPTGGHPGRPERRVCGRFRPSAAPLSDR